MPIGLSKNTPRNSFYITFETNRHRWSRRTYTKRQANRRAEMDILIELLHGDVPYWLQLVENMLDLRVHITEYMTVWVKCSVSRAAHKACDLFAFVVNCTARSFSFWEGRIADRPRGGEGERKRIFTAVLRRNVAKNYILCHTDASDTSTPSAGVFAELIYAYHLWNK